MRDGSGRGASLLGEPQAVLSIQKQEGSVARRCPADRNSLAASRGGCSIVCHTIAVSHMSWQCCCHRGDASSLQLAFAVSTLSPASVLGKFRWQDSGAGSVPTEANGSVGVGGSAAALPPRLTASSLLRQLLRFLLRTCASRCCQLAHGEGERCQGCASAISPCPLCCSDLCSSSLFAS